MLKQQKDAVCIVSSLAISRYNLYHHHKDIEDFIENSTRFLIIGNIDIDRTSKDKTSFLIQTTNRPGALIELLKPFQKRRINLSRIETRPSRSLADAHNFFIDSDGHQKDPKLKQAIAELKSIGSIRSNTRLLSLRIMSSELLQNLNPGIADLHPYEPGRSIDEVMLAYGHTEVIKLASNENPLGASPKALAKINSLPGSFHLYPDGNGTQA